MSECKCDMRTKLVGDGCSTCNPEYYLEILSDQLNELKDEKITSCVNTDSLIIDHYRVIITTQDAIIECQARLLSKNK